MLYAPYGLLLVTYVTEGHEVKSKADTCKMKMRKEEEEPPKKQMREREMCVYSATCSFNSCAEQTII